MIGQLIFAETPFGAISDIPYIERGWIKDCPEKNEWDKQPTEPPKWTLADKAQSTWNKQPAEQSNWALTDRAQNDWGKQPANEVNTIECGDWNPTNLPGLKH